MPLHQPGDPFDYRAPRFDPPEANEDMPHPRSCTCPVCREDRDYEMQRRADMARDMGDDR